LFIDSFLQFIFLFRRPLPPQWELLVGIVMLHCFLHNRAFFPLSFLFSNSFLFSIYYYVFVLLAAGVSRPGRFLLFCSPFDVLGPFFPFIFFYIPLTLVSRHAHFFWSGSPLWVVSSKFFSFFFPTQPLICVNHSFPPL